MVRQVTHLTIEGEWHGDFGAAGIEYKRSFRRAALLPRELRTLISLLNSVLTDDISGPALKVSDGEVGA